MMRSTPQLRKKRPRQLGSKGFLLIIGVPIFASLVLMIMGTVYIHGTLNKEHTENDEKKITPVSAQNSIKANQLIEQRNIESITDGKTAKKGIAPLQNRIIESDRSSEEPDMRKEDEVETISAKDKSKDLAGTFDTNDPGLDSSGHKYHIIFSTGCSAFQDWQSYVFFFHAWKIKQPGIVTRISSGCKPEAQEELQQMFDTQIKPMAPDRFRIHFTPDFSNVKPGVDYKYFNKPFGVKHWFENVLGYPDNPQDEDAIVMLFDPDQLILRPFENNDFTNTEWMYMKGKEPRTKIEHGFPMGQMYAFSTQWKDKTTMAHVAPNVTSPVDSLTNTEAQQHYPVGPPYVATGRDLYRIAVTWSEFVPRVHDEYPHLLAEMFGYCLAAAHLKLPHQMAASFMISYPGSGQGEGWSYVNKLENDELCSNKVDPTRYPSVLHFCQRYSWGPWFFGKYRFPSNFLSCDKPLLAMPPADLVERFEESRYPDGSVQEAPMPKRKHHVFALCHMISAVNEAGRYFRQEHCPNGGNQNETTVFHGDLMDENAHYVFYPYGSVPKKKKTAKKN